MSAAQALSRIFEQFSGKPDLAILEVGCGRGEHLLAAAQRGWRCFGVEADVAARAEAQRCLGETAYIVGAIPDLFAHKFDVVVLHDVLAAYGSPYLPFYELFSAGAIGPETLVVSGNPSPATGALRGVLERLRFREIVDGDPISAKGSDFQDFMQERYVPGTWSKIAAYEHVPRYNLAAPLAAGKAVLDFGCGTGYGAAMLAETAATVTGLDIDESALAWARGAHARANLSFVQSADLGAALPAAAFDVVTCFEMIEHVDFPTQQRVIAGIARLLRDDGLFLISTPNPEVTKLYGANPYHIREMTEDELRDLLSPHFPHVTIFGQHVRAGVTFSRGDRAPALRPASMSGDDAGPVHPMAFIALCGRRPVADGTDSVFFDNTGNYIGEFVAQAQKLQVARAEAYNQRAHAHSAGIQYRIISAERNDAVVKMNLAIQAKNEMENAKNVMEQARDHMQREYDAKVAQIELLARMRAEELRSPRFLARHLWAATRARLRSRLFGK